LKRSGGRDFKGKKRNQGNGPVRGFKGDRPGGAQQLSGGEERGPQQGIKGLQRNRALRNRSEKKTKRKGNAASGCYFWEKSVSKKKVVEEFKEKNFGVKSGFRKKEEALLGRVAIGKKREAGREG